MKCALALCLALTASPSLASQCFDIHANRWAECTPEQEAAKLNTPRQVNTRFDHVLNVALFGSALADNASTFIAIRQSTPDRAVVEGNPFRAPLIGLGPGGATAAQVLLDYIVYRFGESLTRHGYRATARGIKIGIVVGHSFGVGNNVRVIRRTRRG